MNSRNRAQTWVALAAGLLAACSQGTAAYSPPHNDEVSFDGDRAWAQLERIVAFGERPSGSRKIEELRLYLEAELESLGFEPVRESFKSDTPIGEIEFANVYVDIEGETATGDPAPILILGSHFDTKRMDFEFVGANDGGSSTAVLLEIARLFSETERRPPFTYRLLFLDGEEAILRSWTGVDNRYGSREHVAQLQSKGTLERVKAFVLMDLVGDVDLGLVYEYNSDRELLEIFFRAADELGLGKHVRAGYEELLDDHLSFREVGIPGCDLIDWSYGPNNQYWHSKEDTLEHCSRDSLEVMGRILWAGLPGLEDWVSSR